MRYKEYHYRINPIKKQIDELIQVNKEQRFVIHKLEKGFNSISVQCANLKVELLKAQNALTNLLSNYDNMLKEVKK